jgi:hypothetical protein
MIDCPPNSQTTRQANSRLVAFWQYGQFRVSIFAMDLAFTKHFVFEAFRWQATEIMHALKAIIVAAIRSGASPAFCAAEIKSNQVEVISVEGRTFGVALLGECLLGFRGPAYVGYRNLKTLYRRPAYLSSKQLLDKCVATNAMMLGARR